MNLRRKIATLSATLALCAGATVLVASPASATTETVSGSVSCFYGNNTVDGVWVETTSGTSGFAHLSGNGSGTEFFSFTNHVNVGASYRLHVGCGNSPSSWGITYYSNWVTGTDYDWVCSTFDGGCITS